jgi:hypothetical protein
LDTSWWHCLGLLATIYIFLALISFSLHYPLVSYTSIALFAYTTHADISLLLLSLTISYAAMPKCQFIRVSLCQLNSDDQTSFMK